MNEVYWAPNADGNGSEYLFVHDSQTGDGGNEKHARLAGRIRKEPPGIYRAWLRSPDTGAEECVAATVTAAEAKAAVEQNVWLQMVLN